MIYSARTASGMRRPCTRCEKYFHPSSKGSRICETCIEKSRIRLKKYRENKKKIKMQKENGKKA